MNKLFQICAFLCSTICVQAQQQVSNGSFENWEHVNSENAEPTNWNGIMSGDLCGFCSFGASQRIFRDTREVKDGSSSIRIESKSIVGGLIVNGTVTTGRVVAPGVSPSNGYNQSGITDDRFHQPFSGYPDSLVFWAKYSINDPSDSALVSFFFHGQEQLKDPDHWNESTRLVASCHEKFQTQRKWKRFSFPIRYSNSESNIQFLLATFSSSHEAGKGNGNAKLWVDDVQFIYNLGAQTTSFVTRSMP